MVPPHHNIVCELYQNSLFWFQKNVVTQKISTFGLVVPCHEPIALKPGKIFRHVLRYKAICSFCHFKIVSLWCNQICILQFIPVVDKPIQNLIPLLRTYKFLQLNQDNSLLNKVVNQDPYVQICFFSLDKTNTIIQFWKFFYQIRFK